MKRYEIYQKFGVVLLAVFIDQLVTIRLRPWYNILALTGLIAMFTLNDEFFYGSYLIPSPLMVLNIISIFYQTALVAYYAINTHIEAFICGILFALVLILTPLIATNGIQSLMIYNNGNKLLSLFNTNLDITERKTKKEKKDKRKKNPTTSDISALMGKVVGSTDIDNLSDALTEGFTVASNIASNISKVLVDVDERNNIEDTGDTGDDGSRDYYTSIEKDDEEMIQT